MTRPLIGITGRKDTSARLLNSPMHSVGATYVHAIHKVGGTPVILPPVMLVSDWKLLLERLDGLLLSGGEDIEPVQYGEAPESWLGGVDKVRDSAELGLARLVLKQDLPILGICRGHQVLNVALGGVLYQDILAHVPDTLEHALTPGRTIEALAHTVTIEPTSRLAAILGGTEFEVNSAHHQAVKIPGKGLLQTAHAPDGVSEATELPEHPFCLSVQWHPEAMVPHGTTMWPLFEAFVTAAARR